MKAVEALNWIDFLIILFFIKCIYLGAKGGLTSELFKLIGTALAIVVGFHYYGELSVLIAGYVDIPIWLSKVIMLSLVTFLITIIFKYGIVLLLKILNVQFIAGLERAGGALVGFARAILASGLVLIILLFLPAPYLCTSICEKSLLASPLIKSAKKTYTSIIGLIRTQEPKNIDADLPQLISEQTSRS